MTKIDQIKQAHEEMNRLQNELASLGAADTEPDYVYQSEVSHAFNDGQEYDNRTAGSWELYDRNGAKLAAEELNIATRKVINLVLALTVRQVATIKPWAREAFWRVTIS